METVIPANTEKSGNAIQKPKEILTSNQLRMPKTSGNLLGWLYDCVDIFDAIGHGTQGSEICSLHLAKTLLFCVVFLLTYRRSVKRKLCALSDVLIPPMSRVEFCDNTVPFSQTKFRLKIPSEFVRIPVHGQVKKPRICEFGKSKMEFVFVGSGCGSRCTAAIPYLIRLCLKPLPR